MLLTAWIILNSKESFFQKDKHQMHKNRENMNYFFRQQSTFIEQIGKVRFHLYSSRERQKVINQSIHDKCNVENKGESYQG